MGRRTAGWKAPSTSADSEISRALPTLRSRMRELGRNSAHAKKALTVWKNNLVGPGIVPRA
jgi:capsid protein